MKNYKRLFLEQLTKISFSLILFISIIYSSFTYLINIEIYPGNNMEPSIKPGDLIVFDLTSKEYEIDEVVRYSENNILGRIIAKEGDVIDVDSSGYLTLNGYLIKDGISAQMSDVRYPLIINENCYFVLADNLINQSDSRQIGEINKNNINAKILALFRKINF